MVRSRTDLDEDDLAWLHLLMAEWQLIADLSFADLLLFAPMRAELGEAPDFVAVAQMRPDHRARRRSRTTSSAGSSQAGRRPLIDAAFAEGRICREGDPEWREGVPIREETIPVRRGERVIAVVARHTNLSHRARAEPARDRLPAERRRADPDGGRGALPAAQRQPRAERRARGSATA